MLRTTTVRCTASGQTSASLALPYTEVRTQLVRDGISEAVLAACGVELVDKEIIARDIDLRSDPRPLRNALARKSQSKVWQEQRVTLRLPESNIQASEIVLIQEASIDAEQTIVSSKLESATGLLQDYEFEIVVKPAGDETIVEFKIIASIETQTRAIFQSYVQDRVQQGVDEQLQLQSQAFLSAFQPK
jgi:hypothetical protein